jgi:hypothetical protein
MRRKVLVLRAVLVALLVVLGVLVGIVARSLYMQRTLNPRLSCLYLNVTTDSTAVVSVAGIGNQIVVVVLDNTYATSITIDGVTPVPIGITTPAHSLVTVYSTTCNPLVQVYLAFPNGTTIYGQPRLINDQ